MVNQQFDIDIVRLTVFIECKHFSTEDNLRRISCLVVPTLKYSKANQYFSEP